MSASPAVTEIATCSIVTDAGVRTEARRYTHWLRDRLLRSKGHDPSRAGAIPRTDRGKPHLPEDRHLNWSTSSTDGASGLVWCIGRQVGLDLECDDGEIPTDTLLRDTLTDAERSDWDAHPSSGRFMDLWTRKEAALKCLGLGLHLMPNQIHIGAPSPSWTSARVQNRHRCWVRSVHVTEHVRCAIACEVQAAIELTVADPSSWESSVHSCARTDRAE